MNNIAQIVTQIELKIKNSEKQFETITQYREDLITAKNIIQQECTHKHNDGTTAFEKLGEAHGRTLEICTICKKEVTV